MALQSLEKGKMVQESLAVLTRLKFFESKDGIYTVFKLSNSAPQILLIEENLSRRSGSSVCEWALNQKTLGDMAIILISDERNKSEFQDAAASGRMQFLMSDQSLTDLKLAFVKALNFVSGTHAQEFRVRIVPAGEVLIHQGEQASSVFLVRAGKLRAYLQMGSDQKTLGEIGSGEFVGEMAYLNQDMRAASVVAEADSELIEIPIQNVDRILFQRPSWAKALMRTLSKRLKMTIGR